MFMNAENTWATSISISMNTSVVEQRLPMLTAMETQHVTSCQLLTVSQQPQVAIRRLILMNPSHHDYIA